MNQIVGTQGPWTQRRRHPKTVVSVIKGTTTSHSFVPQVIARCENEQDAAAIAALPKFIRGVQLALESASPRDASDEQSPVLISREAYMALRAAIAASQAASA